MANTSLIREKLEAKKREVESQLKRLKTLEAQQRRKDDTRKKIIAGSLALTHAEMPEHEEFRRELYRLISRYTTKPQDRELFGLEPLEEPESEKETG